MKRLLAASLIGAALCSPSYGDAKITDEARRICSRYNVWVEEYQDMAGDLQVLMDKAGKAGNDLVVQGLRKMALRLSAGYPAVDEIAAAEYVLGKPCGDVKD